MAGLLSIAGCQWLGPATPPVPTQVESPAAPLRNPLAEVHKATATHVSTLEIVPVENPAVGLLLQAAEDALRGGDLDLAARKLATAHQLEPDNPRVLQTQAEWHLQQGQWSDAERYARRSHASGAQLGHLCARNWHTLAEIKLALGEDDAQERQQAAACAVPPLPRM